MIIEARVFQEACYPSFKIGISALRDIWAIPLNMFFLLRAIYVESRITSRDKFRIIVWSDLISFGIFLLHFITEYIDGV